MQGKTECGKATEEVLEVPATSSQDREGARGGKAENGNRSSSRFDPFILQEA